MASADLQSTRYEVSDTVEAIEFYYAKGWTDGLPVVPPTESSIRAMLDAAGLGDLGEGVVVDQAGPHHPAAAGRARRAGPVLRRTGRL